MTGKRAATTWTCPHGHIWTAARVVRERVCPECAKTPEERDTETIAMLEQIIASLTEQRRRVEYSLVANEEMLERVRARVAARTPVDARTGR
jgi:hypothetical protein